MIRDCAACLGPDRPAAVARELTKLHESWYHGRLEQLLVELQRQAPRGEYVVVVGGAEPVARDDAELVSLLQPLIDELPLKQAVALAARISGQPRNRIYALALELNGESQR